MKINQLILMLFLNIFVLNIAQATIFYIDPTNGNIDNDGSFDAPWSTLQAVLNNNMVESFANSPLPFNVDINQYVIKNEGAPIKSGDTLMLRDGLHGEVFLQNYNNQSTITIMAAIGHTPIVSSMKLQGCKHWKVEGITISSEPYGQYINGRLLFLETHNFQGPTARIEINNCTIYSTENPWTSADDWVTKVSDGIYARGDSIDIINNHLMNIDMGITAFGDVINATGNEVVNFSGDGMRMLGSNIVFEGNLIKNCYAVDDNHDDGIQSFTTIDNPYINNVIRSNIILNYEDPDQPLLGALQGIGCFDGFYNNWIIENNLVYVNHWHGITLLGANDCQITNNTVIDPTPETTPGASWIRIDDHKNGTPSTGCVVKNNVSNQFVIINGIEENNFILASIPIYENNFVDPAAYDFHLLATSELVDSADDTVAPPFDLDGVSRPQGDHSDIGCYEYLMPVATANILEDDDDIDLFPNPAFNHFSIKTKQEISNYFVQILDINGTLLSETTIQGDTTSIDISALPAGLYFIRIEENEQSVFWIKKLLKQ